MGTVHRAGLHAHVQGLAQAPAGGARFDLGHKIIMGVPELIRLVRAMRGTVVANHLEALSHCPVTRHELAAAAARAGLGERLLVPEDGETLCFELLCEAE